MPLLPISNFILNFVSLLLTSLRFFSLQEHSAQFRFIPLTSVHYICIIPFGLTQLRLFPIVLVTCCFTNVSYPIRECSLFLFKRDRFEIHHQFIEIFWFVMLPLFTKHPLVICLNSLVPTQGCVITKSFTHLIQSLRVLVLNKYTNGRIYRMPRMKNFNLKQLLYFNIVLEWARNQR